MVLPQILAIYLESIKNTGMSNPIYSDAELPSA